jgi:hypothetical protein
VRVAHNEARLTSDLPGLLRDGTYVDTLVNAGGVHVGNGTPTTIERSSIVGNIAGATNVHPRGETIAIDAALLVGDATLTMRDTLVAHNRAEFRTSSTADSGPGGSAVEVDGGGSITGSRIHANPSVGTTSDGIAGVSAGLAALHFSDGPPQLLTVADSTITANRAVARSGFAALAQGGGVLNNALLALHGVTLARNVVEAGAPHGAAQGGGLWNGVLLSGPPVRLDLQGTRIVGNTATGSGGVALQGGGIFTNRAFPLGDTVLSGNRPDDCSGC